MKRLVALIALGMSVQGAQAAFVEFSMEGQVAYLGTGTLDGVSNGTAFRTTFLLDTATYGSADLQSATISSPNWSSGEPVITNFNVSGATFAAVQTTIGSHIFSADSGSGSYGGLLSSPFNGDDYDLFMSVLAPSFTLSFQDLNTTNTGGFGLSELGGDPLAVLAMGFDRVPAFTYFSGDFGLYGLAMQTLSVHEVPEPSTAFLFATAVCVFGFGFGLARGRFYRKVGPA